MAEADISKIVGLIMQNPSLIEQIKNLADGSGEPKIEASEENASEIESSESETATQSTPPVNTVGTKSKRRELLSALKPYLSEERSHAIDALMSIADILDMVKTR